MKENREELDRMLEEMAQETPEMPADFHDRWMAQVRAEAAQNQVPQKESQSRKPGREGRRQWRYILSAAAMFVFLIGGTLLTRNQNRNTETHATPTVSNMLYSMDSGAVANSLPAAGSVNNAVYMDTAAEEAEMAAEDGAACEAEAACEVDGAMYEAAEEAAVNSNQYMESAAEKRTSAKAAENSAMTLGAAMTDGASEEEAVEEAAELEEAEEAAPVKDAPTEAPAETPAETPARESGFVSFLKDLGIFTLKTLAVAAAAAVLALGAAWIHKTWKKRKG